MSNDVITELRACLDATTAFSAERGRAVVVGAMALIASQAAEIAALKEQLAKSCDDERADPEGLACPIGANLNLAELRIASQAAEIGRLRLQVDDIAACIHAHNARNAKGRALASEWDTAMNDPSITDVQHLVEKAITHLRGDTP